MIHTLDHRSKIDFDRRFEIQAVPYFQKAGPVFGVLDSNTLIHIQNVEVIKSFIDGGIITRVGVLRIRRFTSTTVEEYSTGR